MPGVGAGTTKKGALSLLVGAIHRMAQGCHTPMDLMASVLGMSVKFVLSTCSYLVSLVRMALHAQGELNATENETNVRIKLCMLWDPDGP